MFPGVSDSPLPPSAFQTIYDYAGGTNLTYTGWARSAQRAYVTLPSVSSFTAANPGIVTFASAHGLDYQALVTSLACVAVSGGTGNWAAANGVWVFTPTGANTGKISVNVAGTLTDLNTTTFGAVTGTLVFTTRSPRTIDPVWSIKKNAFDAGNKLIWSGWASNPTGAGSGDVGTLQCGSISDNLIWSQRAALSYQ